MSVRVSQTEGLEAMVIDPESYRFGRSVVLLEREIQRALAKGPVKLLPVIEVGPPEAVDSLKKERKQWLLVSARVQYHRA
jgi:hypothetical protein